MTRSVATPPLAGVAVAVVALAAGSTLAVGGAAGGFDRTGFSASCAVPHLPGDVVTVDLADMTGGAMMGSGSSGQTARSMRVAAAPAQVAAGTVSFRVRNTGYQVHELLVLPLPAAGAAGQRTVGADGRVAETGSRGEASRTCGAAAGAGITPAAAGWVTLTLARGRYELVCNIAGHYRAGMYATLTVT